MSVLTQSFIPGMTSAMYDATSSELAPLLEGFNGFLGFHCAAVVDGGMTVTEAWTNEAAYKTWLNDVVATKLPADAISSMKTTFIPLHNVLLTKSLVNA